MRAWKRGELIYKVTQNSCFKQEKKHHTFPKDNLAVRNRNSPIRGMSQALHGMSCFCQWGVFWKQVWTLAQTASLSGALTGDLPPNPSTLPIHPLSFYSDESAQAIVLLEKDVSSWGVWICIHSWQEKGAMHVASPPRHCRCRSGRFAFKNK